MLRSSNPRSQFVRILGCCAVALTLAGCNEYLDRRDSISPVAGDAVRQNMVTHVIDPWPRASHDRNITLSAERAVANTAVPKEAPEDPEKRSAATLGGESR